MYLHLLFIIFCFFFCWNFYLFCKVFKNALVSGNFLSLYLPLIKLIIVSTELDIYDEYLPILSFFPGALCHLLLFGV